MELPYESFPKPTKEQWIAKIQQELKLPEPSLEPLIKILEPDLNIEPIYMEEDVPEIISTNVPNRVPEKKLYYPSHFGTQYHQEISEITKVQNFILDKRFEKNDTLKIISNNEPYSDWLTTSIFIEKVPEQKIKIFFADYYAEAGLTSAQQLAITIFVIENYGPETILWTTNDYFLVSIAKFFAFYKYNPTVKLWIRNELNSYTRKQPHVNLVRGAIAMFAGAMIRPNAMFCLPYNIHHKNAPKQDIINGIRWAVNTLHILEYESKIFENENPLQGAYALEILEKKIYDKSQEYLSELSSENFLQKVHYWIKEAQERLRNENKTKIGANKFILENENIPEDFTKFYSTKYNLLPYGILAEKQNAQ